MNRKVILVTIFLIHSCLVFADTRQSLNLRGIVPVHLKVEEKIHPDGYIQPVIRSNVPNKNAKIKVRTFRSPASVSNNQQVIIEVN